MELILLSLILLIVLFIACKKKYEHFQCYPIIEPKNEINPMCIDETALRNNNTYKINDIDYHAKCESKGGWYPSCTLNKL